MSRNSYEKLKKTPSSAPNLKPELSSGTLEYRRKLKFSFDWEELGYASFRKVRRSVGVPKITEKDIQFLVLFQGLNH
jgi:tRNA/tmRNA/rRNA uracil-C5-methylase (TrmA/RlmC/RlmD family)